MPGPLANYNCFDFNLRKYDIDWNGEHNQFEKYQRCSLLCLRLVPGPNICVAPAARAWVDTEIRWHLSLQHDKHNETQHHTTPHNTTKQNTTQHSKTQHNITRHNITEHHTSPHHTMPHHTSPHHTTTQHNTTHHNT